MAPESGVSTASDLAPAVHPAETFAKDEIISWFRGEFAAANAIIDALCGHLSRLEGGSCEYESVFGAIHRRRMNWIPILQMQKYFSIADVTLELQKVTEMKSRGFQKIEEEVDVSSPKKVLHHEIPKEDPNDRNRNHGVVAVDDDFTRLNSPTSEIKIIDTPGNNGCHQSPPVHCLLGGAFEILWLDYDLTTTDKVNSLNINCRQLQCF